MAYTPIYTPKNFSDWGPPDLDASNLNDIEAALVSLGNGLQTAAADTDANKAAITTINGEISDLNNLIDEILPDDSESGNPAVITDAFAAECKSLVLTLEPIQSGSGTPSPANPRPITGRTQSKATRTNRNVLPFINETKTAANVKVEPAGNGRYNFTGTSTGNVALQLYITEKFKGVCKFVSDNYNRTTGSSISLYVQDIGGGNMEAITPDTDIDFDVREVVSLAFYAGTGAVCNYHDVGFALIPDSATDKSFEPYVTPESITRTYGTTIYGGSDDITGEGATIIKDAVDLGSLEWEEVTTAQTGKKRFRTVIPNAKQADTSKLTSICSNYALLVNEGTWPATNTGYTITAYSEVVLYDDNLATLSAADFKTAMSGVVMVYELINPSSISLTPQNLTLLKGDNVITTNADNVDVEYKADIALYIAKQLGGNMGNRGAKSTPAEEPADDTKEEEKTDEKIIEPVTKEAKK